MSTVAHITGEQVVAQARAWLGTPYHHQARLRGVGVDCIGLLIGVCRELGTVAPDFDVNGYPREADGITLMHEAILRMEQIERADMRYGDAVVTAFRGVPHHFGLLGDYRHGGFSIIHAYSLATPARVLETRLMFRDSIEFAAAFRLPGVA